MRNTILIIFLTFFSFAQAQKVEKENRTFKNQGQQEDYWAEKLFTEKYIKQNFERFAGKIFMVNENIIKYDNEVLIVNNTEKQLIAIFEKGIFYPSIITGKVKTGISRKQDLDSMLIRNDSLRISNFKELNFLNKSAKAKRFKFWLYLKGMANPTAYFIELTNEKADEKTDTETFINNSKLTFCKRGWIGL